MQTGILSESLDEGELSMVSFDLYGDKSGFEIRIMLDIDNRSDDLTEDDDDDVCDIIDDYFDEKDLKQLFSDNGYNFDDCFWGFLAFKL